MAGHAYFYFRDPGYVNTFPTGQHSEFLERPLPEEITKYGTVEAERLSEKRRGQLAALKELIRSSGVPVQEGYRDPVRFGELVKEDLMRVIDSLAPPPAPLTDAERANAALDREDMAQEEFAASRFGVYIPRQDYFDRLDAHAAGDTSPLVVLGDSGSGKSALLAHWAYRYRAHHPDDLVLLHFVGASSESTDWAAMLRRFMGEFKRKFNLSEEIPVKEYALRTEFLNWLSMAAAHGRVVLVIDALNHLEDRHGALDLIWLPLTIPGNIRLIVSTLPGRPLDTVRKLGWPAMTVEPLTVSERDTLITCYLHKYRRELSIPLRERLAAADQTKNPLFLRSLLEELRVHGEFERLTRQIEEYLTAQTIDSLLEMILKRYECDYDRDRPGLVKDTTSLLWAARRGLSKPELMDILGRDGRPLPDAYWAPLFLVMEHSLVEKSGLFTFFHEYIRQAVEHRYLTQDKSKMEAYLRIADYFEPKEKRGLFAFFHKYIRQVVEHRYLTQNNKLKLRAHLRIADYFESKENSPRKIAELPWQYMKLDRVDDLHEIVSDMKIFPVLHDTGDLNLYQSFIIERYFSIDPEKGIKTLWELFSCHMGNGSDFLSAGHLIMDSLKQIKNIFGKGSPELIKSLYWIGWTRKNIDNEYGASQWYRRALNEITRSGSFENDEILSWLRRTEVITLLTEREGELQRSNDNPRIHLSFQSAILQARGEHEKAMELLKEYDLRGGNKCY